MFHVSFNLFIYLFTFKCLISRIYSDVNFEIGIFPPQSPPNIIFSKYFVRALKFIDGILNH